MAINIGTQGIGGIYVGTQEIGKVYVGSQLVYEKASAIETVTIGGRIWTLRNLSINDGLGGIYPPNGNAANVADYGFLYTVAAATRIAATLDRWRLPTGGELASIGTGASIKETGLLHWNSPNTGATNATGFTGRAAGMRNTNGTYAQFMNILYMWTSDNYYKFARWDNTALGSGSSTVQYAFSIRLLKY